jgi:hypothetical protein
MNRGKTSDALRALQDAKKAAQANAASRQEAEPATPEVDDDEATCFVKLSIACYLHGYVLGMGAMPDGSALWLRLRCPATSDDPRAGMVAFCVSDDSLGILQKAVAALDASPKSKWWKPDRFAPQTDTGTK